MIEKDSDLSNRQSLRNHTTDSSSNKKPAPDDDQPRKKSRSTTTTIVQNTKNKKKKHVIRRSKTPPLQDTETFKERNVELLCYGKYEIVPWYYSPYPNDFGAIIDRLYVCDICLRYMKEDGQLASHKVHCRKKGPPGVVVYASENLKIYEINGEDHKFYCQNLCLLAKLFLDHKTLYYDVDGFMFYVLVEIESKSKELVVGYFSKEKISYDNYNLACIMTLPSHQRKGYGRLLIEWSYELSRREGVIGSPEKPLSVLGLLGYHSYWSSLILSLLQKIKEKVSIATICQITRLHENDVIDTLSRLGLLRFQEDYENNSNSNNSSNSNNNGSTIQIVSNNNNMNNMNNNISSKSKSKSSVSSSSTTTLYHFPSSAVIHITPEMIQEAIKKHRIHFYRKLDPSCILI
ncbi:unnamed protein product [Cunninghamella blakesleeana]